MCLTALGRYKFDDEHVTKEEMKRALEDQYGGGRRGNNSQIDRLVNTISGYVLRVQMSQHELSWTAASATHSQCV